MQPQQRGQGGILTPRDTFHLMYFLARGYATCFTVFTRHTFGQESLGMHGLAALILIPVYGSFAKVPEMFDFWGFWFIALVIQRLRTLVVVRNGMQLHSQFAGTLWLGSLFGVIKSYRGAVLVEIVACVAVGHQMQAVSKGFGAFVQGGGGALLLVYLVEHQARAMAIRRMRDAEIEMRSMTELYRSNGNDF